jgi:drug/metabolite transporter (DMT)-like permease
MFSASLPFTRVAVREFGIVFPTFGRAVIAGLIAAVALVVTRSRVPSRELWPSLALVALGVVVGFPALTGLALQHAPAGHGAVVIGLLPAATAGWSVLRNRTRPSARYWMFVALGATAVLALAIGGSSPSVAASDLFLVGAVISAAIGYGEGAIVSRSIGGWQTISWAVVISLPVSIVLTVVGAGPVQWDEPATAWLALGYLGVVSMYLGFFAWYAGLALGGVERVSQVQLLQPTLSLVWATLFLHEQLDPMLVVVAAIVMCSVAGSRRAAIAT